MKKIFLLFVFFPVFIFSQTNYYVALEINGGNDSLNTGTINSPFKTINKAYKGETPPFAPNNNPSNKQLNRRTEIILLRGY